MDNIRPKSNNTERTGDVSRGNREPEVEKNVDQKDVDDFNQLLDTDEGKNKEPGQKSKQSDSVGSNAQKASKYAEEHKGMVDPNETAKRKAQHKGEEVGASEKKGDGKGIKGEENVSKKEKPKKEEVSSEVSEKAIADERKRVLRESRAEGEGSKSDKVAIFNPDVALNPVDLKAKVDAKAPVNQVDTKLLSDMADKLGAEIKVMKPSELGQSNTVKISLQNMGDRRLDGTTFEIAKNGNNINIVCNPSTPEGRAMIETSLQPHLQVKLKDDNMNVTISMQSQDSMGDGRGKEDQRSRGEYVPEEGESEEQ